MNCSRNLVGISFFKKKIPSPFSGWVWHGGQFLSAKREGERKEGKEGKERKGKREGGENLNFKTFVRLPLPSYAKPMDAPPPIGFTHIFSPQLSPEEDAMYRHTQKDQEIRGILMGKQGSQRTAIFMDNIRSRI